MVPHIINFELDMAKKVIERTPLKQVKFMRFDVKINDVIHYAIRIGGWLDDHTDIARKFRGELIGGRIDPGLIQKQGGGYLFLSAKGLSTNGSSGVYQAEENRELTQKLLDDHFKQV
ncbi:MAG: hypothetical protein KA052_01375 [Candidatus Pacebacteria bacterium]|nr:hypothetical protein [Candidatus Paceibacterota bacterium]